MKKYAWYDIPEERAQGVVFVPESTQTLKEAKRALKRARKTLQAAQEREKAQRQAEKRARKRQAERQAMKQAALDALSAVSVQTTDRAAAVEAAKALLAQSRLL